MNKLSSCRPPEPLVAGPLGPGAEPRPSVGRRLRPPYDACFHATEKAELFVSDEGVARVREPDG